MARNEISEPCSGIVELLPWWVNGTLDGDEAALVRSHLVACAACRREVEELLEVCDLFEAHIPSLDLARYALGSEPTFVHREVLEIHLASCPSCSVECELAAGDNVVGFGESRDDGQMRRWRHLATAASILAVVATGGLVVSLVGNGDLPDSGEFGEGRANSDAGKVVVASRRESENAAPEVMSMDLLVDGFEAGSMEAWYEARGDRASGDSKE